MPNIGIDFGTTNSVVVAYDKKKNEFLYFNYTKSIGGKPVPMSSTVWYHDNVIEVGKNAREKIHEFGDVEGHHFERSIKLKLGESQNLNIFGTPVPPYKVAGEILSKLKKTAIEEWKADKVGADMSRAVFTVPIRFEGKKRRDLRKAANEAGIEITTFIHEPFAAIVGYFFNKYKEDTSKTVVERMKNLNGKYILTFDWGGGTLDITVVRVQEGRMLELGTAELTNVAGDKFDEDIANFVWNKFIDKYGFKYSEEYLEQKKKKKWDRLLAFAERCKLELSQKESSEFYMERVIDSDDIDLVITRSDFEGMIANALDDACNKIDDALRQAGIQDIDLSYVLLTGGSCYIPAVINRMNEKFGRRVENVKDADLAIAQGAAVISEMGWLPFLTKDTMIELSDGTYWSIFEAGMPVAAGDSLHNSEVFTCVDQTQKRAKIIVCEGRDQQKDKNLAVFNVPILGDNRFGDDIVVEAILDRDIVLTVKGHSKMVQGYARNEEYSVRKSVEIHQLCFGLDFTGA